MQIPDAHPYCSPDDSEWYLLTEWPLSEFLSDLDQKDVLSTRLLFQAVRRLVMPSGCVEKIEMTLAEFAKEDWGRRKPGERGGLGQVRVFCQRKIIDAERSGYASLQPHSAGQATEQAPMLFNLEKKLNGGWGFFLIERGGIHSPGFAARMGDSVDVYLYKEGE